MGLDFGKLAARVGGTVKEAGRNALTNGLLDTAGLGAMSGQVNYAEYEYDANGHIKGVSSKYQAAIEDKYQGQSGIDLNAYNAIDGNTGGLTSGTSRFTKKDDFLSKYPIKYNDANANLASYKSYRDALEKAEKAKNKPASSMEERLAQMDAEIKSMKFNADGTMTKVNNTAQSQKSLQGMLYNDVTTPNYDNYAPNEEHGIVNDPLSDILALKLPDWSYADFINERAIWQKGLSSIFDEPGWFYFKIFFDFDTNHGLFGGLLNSKYLTTAVNSAAKYLYTIRHNHRYVKPKDRINALYKFTSILSYINSNAPWYFKSVHGLNKVANPVVDNFSNEQSIELEVTQDAIDMRLSTIMSLYNYACFDSVTDREIIPSNLRKFNMTIILFQTPLRYLHTSYTTNEKQEFMGIDIGGIKNEINGLLGKKNIHEKINYKNMTPNNGSSSNFADVMSMKVYTLYGCEFDKESFANIIPNNISNEKPFQMGNSSIKITYTMAMEHSMNEFYGMMFGSDGFFFNQYSNFQLSVIDKGGASDIWNGYVNTLNDNWSKQTNRYKALSDTLEDIARGGTILGLVDSPRTYKKAIDATEAVMNGLFDNPGLLTGLASNFALGLLGSSKNTNAPQGNIYGDYGIGSAYYKDKLEMLKNGVHERTTAPYYIDPATQARVDFHKDKQYSAYNFKNDISAVKNFNVTNWLDTQTQKAASWINDKAREGLSNLVWGKNQFTEQPYTLNPYNKDTAQETDAKKWEGVGKSHEMVDDPNTWDRVEKPYNYEQNKKGNS